MGTVGLGELAVSPFQYPALGESKMKTELSEIYSFRAVGDRLGTAGQPTQDQFRKVREAGFEAVINLALPTSDNAIANEGSVVTGLGMSYVHIPVDFKAPAPQDFRAFCRVMEAFEGRPVFVHCAANMRVSAFVFLYRILCQRVAVPRGGTRPACDLAAGRGMEPLYPRSTQES
jgi:protein tyrosine phosphatase (PTP) superfamily phosphohydrolase (DUF442 family)